MSEYYPVVTIYSILPTIAAEVSVFYPYLWKLTYFWLICAIRKNNLVTIKDKFANVCWFPLLWGFSHRYHTMVTALQIYGCMTVEFKPCNFAKVIFHICIHNSLHLFGLWSLFCMLQLIVIPILPPIACEEILLIVGQSGECAHVRAFANSFCYLLADNCSTLCFQMLNKYWFVLLNIA
jgi:hypothetical protein